MVQKLAKCESREPVSEVTKQWKWSGAIKGSGETSVNQEVSKFGGQAIWASRASKEASQPAYQPNN